MNWKFWRRRTQADKRFDDIERRLWEARQVAGGWHQWLALPPPRDSVVEIMRFGWAASHLCVVAQMHPATNIWGLWWREHCGPEIGGTVIVDVRLPLECK